MRNENISVMNTLLLHLLIFLPALVVHNYEALEACCQTKTASGNGPLDGVYRLEKSLNTLPSVCGASTALEHQISFQPSLVQTL